MRALASTLVVALALSGCSAIFIDKPAGRPPPGVPLKCTTSRVVPFIDTYIAALSLIGTVVVAATPCNKEEFGCLGKVLIVPLGGLAIGYGVSAFLGHDAVTTCRELSHPSLTPPPSSAPPPPPPLPSPPPLGWTPMLTGADGIEVHSGLSDVAPIIARLPPGTTVMARPMGVGWVLVRLPDGRAGYARPR